MTDIKKAKGFTLIELIIILVVLAVLAGIAVPVYFHIQSEAIAAADIATLSYLNQITGVYKTNAGITGPAFPGAATDAARIGVLISAGYFSEPPAVQQPGMVFVWSIPAQAWQLEAAPPS